MSQLGPYNRMTSHRSRFSITQWMVSVAMPAIALVLSLLAIWLWYTETSEEPFASPPNGTPASVDQVNITLERANDAVNSVELVLSFLEGASVIITIAIAATAIVGLSSIGELREAVDETEQELLQRVEAAESRLQERAERLANMEELIAEAERRMDRLVEERLQKVYADTESARQQSAALARHALAEQLMREHNIDAAMQACAEAYQLDPKNYANNYLYGMLLIEKGEYHAAISKLQEALDEDPGFVPAIAALGLANRREGDQFDDRRTRNEYYNIAEARLLEAIQADANLLTHDGESYFGTLGSLYRRTGRIEDALDSYRRAAEVTPRRSYPFVNLAMLFYKLGDVQMRDQNLLIAERNAKRRLEDTPTDFWALYDLGLTELMRSEATNARQYFKEAIDYTPASIGVYYSVVARLIFLQAIDNAIPGLDENIELLDQQIKRFNIG